MPNPAPVVVVLHGGTPPAEMARIQQHAELRYATPEQLPDAIPGADVLFVWDFRAEALPQAWPTADQLTWIHTATAGVDHLLTSETLASEVTLTNSRGVFDQPMAEYVLACVLTFAKDLHTTLRQQDRRHWQHRVTERIAGRTALIIGTGPIGRAIATQLTAAGMHITAAGRTPREHDPDFGQVRPSAELAHYIGHHDYIVLAAPLTEQTKGIVDATALAGCKPTARLINVGRGELVVEDDLVDALRAGQLAGAALDVFDTEPLPDTSPLWDLPDVLVSPHMSGDTTGWIDELLDLFLTNVDNYRNGRTLHNTVNKQRGYVSGTEH